MVITVANYRRQKNYPVLLEAAARAVAQNAHLRFVVVGQGPLAGEVHSLHTELRLGQRMLLLGYRPDAVSVIAAGDVFTLSSDYEGLPVALMEALALGRAIVATDVGGIRETIKRGAGILVRPRDPDALADALLRVARDPSLLLSLQQGAARLGDDFDVQRSVTQLVALYSSLVSHAP